MGPKARVLYCNSMEDLAMDKYSRLLSLFISCKENEGHIHNTLFSS
jgi:hypothetical protein